MPCSKPCRCLFTDLICRSCSDLLIAAFSVRWGFVIVVVLWLFVWTNYGWSSREETGLFRCLLIIYWFLSSLFAVAGACVFVCPCTCLFVREGMFVKDRWGWVVVSMCWKWVDLIYTGLFTPQRGRAPRASVASLLPSSFVPCLCFLSDAHSILSLLFPGSFVSYSPGIFLCLPSLHCNLLSLSANICLVYLFTQFRAGCFLLFCLFLFHSHSLRIHFHLLFTPSSFTYLLWLHLVFFTAYQTVNFKSNYKFRRCQW